MAHNDLIDQYVMSVRRQLAWRRDIDDITDELDDHLRSAAASLVEQGAELSEAQRRVVDRFGAPAHVSMSFISTGSRGKAIPTQFTNSAGVLGVVSAVAWCAVAFAWNSSYLAERVTGDWGGVPWVLFMVATMALLTAATTQVVLILGLDRRHGGLGLLGAAAIAASVLGALACLVSWFVPGWAALLGLGVLLLAVPLLRRGLAPRIAVVVGALAWPLALCAMAGLSALQLGPMDQFGDHPIARNIGLSVGALLSAISLVLLGRWLAREETAGVPAPARVI